MAKHVASINIPDYDPCYALLEAVIDSARLGLLWKMIVIPDPNHKGEDRRWIESYETAREFRYAKSFIFASHNLTLTYGAVAEYAERVRARVIRPVNESMDRRAKYFYRYGNQAAREIYPSLVVLGGKSELKRLKQEAYSAQDPQHTNVIAFRKIVERTKECQSKSSSNLKSQCACPATT